LSGIAVDRLLYAGIAVRGRPERLRAGDGGEDCDKGKSRDR